MCAVNLSSNSGSDSQLLLSWEMRWACLPMRLSSCESSCFYKRLNPFLIFQCFLILNKVVIFPSFIGINLSTAMSIVKLGAVQFAQEKPMSI